MADVVSVLPPVHMQLDCRVLWIGMLLSIIYLFAANSLSGHEAVFKKQGRFVSEEVACLSLLFLLGTSKIPAVRHSVDITMSLTGWSRPVLLWAFISLAYPAAMLVHYASLSPEVLARKYARMEQPGAILGIIAASAFAGCITATIPAPVVQCATVFVGMATLNSLLALQAYKLVNATAGGVMLLSTVCVALGFSASLLARKWLERQQIQSKMAARKWPKRSGEVELQTILRPLVKGVVLAWVVKQSIYGYTHMHIDVHAELKFSLLNPTLETLQAGLTASDLPFTPAAPVSGAKVVNFTEPTYRRALMHGLWSWEFSCLSSSSPDGTTICKAGTSNRNMHSFIADPVKGPHVMTC